jgi:hypothetical protein
MMNVGKRTYDEHGSTCRPSDTYNELRAIVIMRARFPAWQQKGYKYQAAEERFADVDGKWLCDGTTVGYSEIKSHSGRQMGDTTILNIRKWNKLVALQNQVTVPVLFITQYENVVAWQEVNVLRNVVSILQPITITDTKSVSRPSNTEPVWMIPTACLQHIYPDEAPLDDAVIAMLETLMEDIRQ